MVFSVLSLILSRPMPDEGSHMTGGWLLLNGTIPYLDFFSVYSPGIYFLLALFYTIFPPDFVASRLFALAVNLITLTTLFALCKKFMREKVALLACLFFVIWSVFTMSWNILIEPFLALFSVLLIYSILTFFESKKFKHFILIAFLLSGLVLLKQTMLIFSTAVGLLFLFKLKPSLKELSIFLISYASLPILFIIYLFSNNAFGAFLDQAVFYTLTHYTGEFALQFKPGWVIVTLVFLSIPLLALLLMLLKKIRIEKFRAALLFLWFILFLPTLMPVFGCCAHHTPLVPVFAIFFGLIIESVFFNENSFKFKQIELRGFLKAFLALVFFSGIAASGIYLPQYFCQNDFVELFEISEYVKLNSVPTDTLYVTAYDTEIYFFALRKPATNYFYFPHASDAEEDLKYRLEIVQSLEENKPLFVVNFSRTLEPVPGDNLSTKYILENYRVVKTVEFRKPLYDIYNYGFVLKRKE